MAYRRVALFGGVYSNHIALRAAIDDAQKRGCDAMFCLGDLGAFGPNPDKIFPLLIDAGVRTMQGNYDNSIGNDLPDCQCGYTDPADNYFARLSYQYTFNKTSPRWRPWLAGLEREIRFELARKEEGVRGQRSGVRAESGDENLPSFGPVPCALSPSRSGQESGVREEKSAENVSSLSPVPCALSPSRSVLCCHGSPRRTNEFLWESTTPTHLLEKFCDDHAADVIVATHTGLPWTRTLSKQRLFVNCGVLGRPANDGTTRVGYSILDAGGASYVSLEYDYEALAHEMKQEALPEPFIETIRSGWWTTCLEILPGKERMRGKY